MHVPKQGSLALLDFKETLIVTLLVLFELTVSMLSLHTQQRQVLKNSCQHLLFDLPPLYKDPCWNVVDIPCSIQRDSVTFSG